MDTLIDQDDKKLVKAINLARGVGGDQFTDDVSLGGSTANDMQVEEQGGLEVERVE